MLKRLLFSKERRALRINGTRVSPFLGFHVSRHDVLISREAAAHAFQARFLGLDNRIEHFKRFLPALSSQGTNHTEQSRPDIVKLRCLLCCHTLAHSATIQLHTPIQQGQDPTNSRTLAAAISAANLLREVNAGSLGIVDPIMGVSYSAYCSSRLSP